MLQKALVLVLAVASITGFTSCGSTANHYIYASLSAANQIIVYREDPNSGVLTQIVGSPYTVGNGVISLALHPSGKFLYAANPGTGGNPESDISLFNIASNGALTEVFPRTSVAPAASQPQLLRIDSAGAFLYVENAGSQNISVFSIASSTGALTPVAGSPFFLGGSPLNMQLTPSGNYLFVSIAGQNSGSILTFSTNSGVLTPVSGINTDGPNPDGLAVNPAGTYLYASNYSSLGSISIFKIGTAASPGALQEVPGSPLSTGYIAPLALTLDPKGQYLYVANQGSNNVAAYSLSTTGLPNILTTSTTTGAFATEGSPSFLVFDPSGKYLYVGNQGSSAGIQAFSVSAGNLTALSTYSVGNTPYSIVDLAK